MSNYLQKAQEFLDISEQFQLGKLTTESFHPRTIGLSETAKLNPHEAIKQFRSVDEEMLHQLVDLSSSIERLSEDIHSFLKNSTGRIFLCGCGATGRLSLTLELIAKSSFPEIGKRVVSLMAGGDAALVSSIEKFEDYSSYAHQQLEDLNFCCDDFLIAITEGGETPWVIGACQYALNISAHSPYFLYCNKDSELESIKRSREILQNPKVKKLCLYHCPQALSGSTRLQASTIQMACVGFALFPNSEVRISERLRYFKDWYLNLDLKRLSPFIIEEALSYQKNRFVHYYPDPKVAISVFTDTTERSPTFNLSSFEAQSVKVNNPSKCYVILASCADSDSAWFQFLGRNIRALEWQQQKEVVEKAGLEKVKTFDFSQTGLKKRLRYINSKAIDNFYIKLSGDVMMFEFKEHQTFFEMPKTDTTLVSHLMLKMILNLHSTLLMGRLSRYESNIMTWVKPSNNKLIDRAVRYAGQILKQDGYVIEYNDLVKECFRIMEQGPSSNESIVLKIVQSFKLQ